ncbi:hypothetical protein Pelo_6571 [Pelomyxa schiedti]|nr:hypothetical protein Pelo_6571 [Pelomyxa schiedti]
MIPYYALTHPPPFKWLTEAQVEQLGVLPQHASTAASSAHQALTYPSADAKANNLQHTSYSGALAPSTSGISQVTVESGDCFVEDVRPAKRPRIANTIKPATLLGIGVGTNPSLTTPVQQRETVNSDSDLARATAEIYTAPQIAYVDRFEKHTIITEFGSAQYVAYSLGNVFVALVWYMESPIDPTAQHKDEGYIPGTCMSKMQKKHYQAHFEKVVIKVDPVVIQMAMCSFNQVDDPPFSEDSKADATYMTYDTVICGVLYWQEATSGRPATVTLELVSFQLDRAPPLRLTYWMCVSGTAVEVVPRRAQKEAERENVTTNSTFVVLAEGFKVQYVVERKGPAPETLVGEEDRSDGNAYNHRHQQHHGGGQHNCPSANAVIMGEKQVIEDDDALDENMTGEQDQQQERHDEEEEQLR